MSKLVTQAEFARIIQHDKSHVTRLKQVGRLVMQGSRVDVDASIELIAATAGTRDDVKQRHEAGRADATVMPAASVEEPKWSPETIRNEEETRSDLKEAQRIKAMAESRRVSAAADREEMERDKMAGDLIAREDVDAAMKFVGSTIRAQLDVLPDQLAPVIAPVTDIGEVHAMLVDACRNVLVGLGDAIEKQLNVLDGKS